MPPEKELLRRKYELGMTLEQIALAENRPANAVAREITSLHTSLVSALRQSLNDSDLPPPGGAADLGRLTDQLLDGTITDAGRLILETLLLADLEWIVTALFVLAILAVAGFVGLVVYLRMN